MRQIYPWISWLDCLYLRKDTSYNSILVIAYRLTKMVTRLFELGCSYHPRASHEDIDPRSRSKATNELADDMQKELSAQIRHSKSLSAGPLELCAWISLLINWMSHYTRLKIWQISLRRTLWGFEHRFGHKLGIKSKCQQTIKAQSLETTLPAIIFICDVFHMSLLEQDTIRKG